MPHTSWRNSTSFHFHIGTMFTMMYPSWDLTVPSQDLAHQGTTLPEVICCQPRFVMLFSYIQFYTPPYNQSEERSQHSHLSIFFRDAHLWYKSASAVPFCFSTSLLWEKTGAPRGILHGHREDLNCKQAAPKIRAETRYCKTAIPTTLHGSQCVRGLLYIGPFKAIKMVNRPSHGTQLYSPLGSAATFCSRTQTVSD